MKNWTIKEAINVINAGTDEAAIKELAKHFPMFFLAVAKNDMVALANAMGDKFTVRKLDFGSTPAADDNDTDEAETETGSDEAATPADVDLNSMSTKQLMKLCDERGIKVPHYGKNKQFYLDALNAAGSTPAADEADEDEDATEGENPYEGKSAMELFKECKKRGIKAAAKKPAKYYVDLLLKADAETGDEAEEEDDWGDDEAEAEAPKAPKKSAGKGGAKKSAPKKAAKAEPEADEDDGDDWDI